MHVISQKALWDFAKRFPNADAPLRAWYKLIKNGSYQNFAELKQTFPSVDYVPNLYVFDIGGNKYRLIAAIHFKTQKVFIRYILTHTEYDKGGWKK